MRTLLALLLALWTTTLLAAIEVRDFEVESERERYRAMLDELRCPKCQNQSLSGSDAPIAADLRNELARLIREGHSDEEIIDFMVQRYGDFVRYRPPLNAHTVLLWGAPVLMLAIGGVIVFALVRRQRRLPDASTPLTPEEHERARRLLEEGDDPQ